MDASMPEMVSLTWIGLINRVIALAGCSPWICVLLCVQNGFECTRVIRSCEDCYGGPFIIALTANATLEDRERA